MSRNPSRLGKLFLLTLLLVLIVPVIANAQTSDENTLVIAQSVDIGQLDPASVNSRSESNIFYHMYGTLFEIGDDGSITPYLASAYKVSEDGKEWTFTLNEGLTCHDGEALTAEDAAYSFERAADPANAFTGNTAGFVLPAVGYLGTRVDDELNVTILTDRYQSIGLGLLSEVYIHCKDSYSAMTLEEAAQNPIGSGPYKFVEWVPDDHVTLAKIDGFTLRETTFATQIWRVIPEASTRVAELIAGNVDVIGNVPPDQVEAVNGSGVASVQAVQGTRRIYVGFQFGENFKDAPGYDALQKTDVRVALQYAIDVPTICAALLGTECTRATGLVNDPNGNPNLQPYPYDPVKAGELLDAAGYPKDANGVRFETTLMGPRGRYLNDANVVQAIAQYLTDVGVVTTADIRDWADYRQLTGPKEVGPMFFLGSGGGTWNALYDMADLSAPDAGTNYTNWQNEEWFTLWNSLADIRDAGQEREVINKMLEVFYNDPPWLLLYFQPDFYGVSNRLDWQARRDEQIVIYNAKLK